MASISSNGTGGGFYDVGGTWAGGVVPVDGDKVTIAATDTVTIRDTRVAGDDTTTAFTVNGVLKFSRVANSQLTVKGLLLTAATTTATIDIGRKSISDPIPAGITATIVENYSAAMANYKYGIFIDDTSNFYACGATKNNNARITSSISAGGTSCTVDDATGWAVGDTVVMAPSDGTSNHYDKRTISTLTPGAGTTATITFAATSFAHATNCPIGNFTSNVTIKSFNTTNPGYFCMKHTSTASNNRREIDYVSFQYVTSNNAQAASQVFVTQSNTATCTPLVSCSHNTLYNGYSNSGIFMNGWLTGTPFYLDSWSFFNDDSLGGACYYTGSGTFVGIKNSVWYYTAGPWVQSAFSQGGQGCLYTNNTYCATGSPFAVGWTNGDGGFFTTCGFHTSASNTQPLITMNAGSANFVQCNFGYTGSITNSAPALWGTPVLGYVEKVSGPSSKGTFVLTDCYFGTPVQAFADSGVPTANPQWTMTVVNKQADVTQQELYTYAGPIIRDNSTFNRSNSSEKFSPNTASRAHSRTYQVFAPNSTARTVVGYLQYDATFGGGAVAYPTVTLSGLGITPQTFTASAGSSGTWQKFSLSATQTSGADGYLTLTVTGTTTATTGNYWLDGIIDPPFVTACRHYGYIFDSNIYRTTDTVIQQTNEATVGAYTGISIAGSTITLTSNHSIREVYDYCKWYLCQTANLGVADFFTSTDGVNFTSTYNLTLNGGNLTGSGTLTLGSKTFTRSGSETSTIPITYNSGAAVFTTINISGLVTNSRVYVQNVTDSTDLYNAVVAATSVSIPVTWTADKTLKVRTQYTVGTSSYLPTETTGTLTSTGASFTITQTTDTVYNTNAIDGSTVTEFTADYPNVFVDITDPDGVTTIQRLYAWYRYNEYSSSGIKNFQSGIVADDSSNYQIHASVINLKLTNLNVAPVYLSGARLYRDDGSTVIASSSNSIQLDPSKAYIAADASVKLDELHKIQGLSSGNPMTVTLSSRSAGSINLAISGDNRTTTTVTRQ